MPKDRPRFRLRRCAIVGLVLALAASSACTSTRGRRGTPPETGFLGDYSQLEKNPEFEASLTYINPDVVWAKYDSIELDSVGLWGNEQTAKISAEDRQRLTNVLFAALNEELGKYFTLVPEGGPTAIRLRVAITQASGANVPLRTVTTVVPQLRAAGALVGLGADTATTVGTATVEAEALDTVTNERLGAVVDRRAGTKVLFAKRAYQTWGDVYEACQEWSKAFAWRLARLGLQLKPGAPMPEKPVQSRTI